MQHDSAIYPVSPIETWKKYVRWMWKYRSRPIIRKAIKSHIVLLRKHGNTFPVSHSAPVCVGAPSCNSIGSDTGKAVAG